MQLDQFSEAAVGSFAEITGRTIREGDWKRGYLSLNKDSVLLVILDERDYEERFGRPYWESESILGITEYGPVLVTDIPARRGASAFGTKASSQRYNANALIAGFDTGARSESKFISASVSITGVRSWGGLSALVEELGIKSDNRFKSARINLDSTEVVEAALEDGRKLEVRGGWGLSGPPDERLVTAPIVFTIRSTRKRLLAELVDPLYHVQDLLGLALNQQIGGKSASARLAGTGLDAKLWERNLLRDAENSSSGRYNFPLFTMSDIGGVPGVARWIRLTEEHWRATGPVVRRYRYGAPLSEEQLLSVAAGIEYWVALHRKTSRKWAADKHYPRALANHVGRSFAEWVGDVHAWSEAFWSTYLDLKHLRPGLVDAERILILGTSARWLLAAAMLDRAAGTKAPSRAIFGSHHLRHDRAAVRRTLGL